MKVEIVAPLEFQGAIIGGINQRKGSIVDTEIRDDEFTLTAEVSLNDMFGCECFIFSSFLDSLADPLFSSDASQLRGASQGKAEYSMTYQTHEPVLPFVQKQMIEEYTKFTKK